MFNPSKQALVTRWPDTYHIMIQPFARSVSLSLFYFYKRLRDCCITFWFEIEEHHLLVLNGWVLFRFSLETEIWVKSRDLWLTGEVKPERFAIIQVYENVKCCLILRCNLKKYRHVSRWSATCLHPFTELMIVACSNELILISSGLW